MNYFNNANARVGFSFRGNPPTRGAQQGIRGDEEEEVYNVQSINSGITQGGVNLLAGRENQSGRGDTHGQAQRGEQAQQGGLANIPDKIDNKNMQEVGSNITGMGGAGDHGIRQGGGQPPNFGEKGQLQPRKGPGGAIAARINTLTNRQSNAVIGRKLEWQSRAEGDQAKSIAFRDQVVHQANFRAFAFMKGKSPAVHMAHSVGQFFGISGGESEVQGKYIGFIGDRGNGRYPVPFILPPQNTWL
jgi:hypothetical protein